MPDIRELIDRELPELVKLRHDLHRHPEVMFEEERTSRVVQRELAALGIEHRAGMAGGTGVLGHLPGNGGSTVALRADMDALPILEETGKPYASVNEGVMHACGHDGHTTILLGAARVLSKIDRPNSVTFVFQPAEEGGAGGEKMCAEGALLGAGKGGLGSPVEKIFGLHGWPDLPVGQVATRAGPLMASTDEFDVAIRGSQAHAAYPHFGADPILGASHVVAALQTIASRNVGPLDSIVVTVGTFHGGTAMNVIPSSVRITGTIRTLRDSTRRLARERFHEVVNHTARAQGCTADIQYSEGYPVVDNDTEATDQFFGLARETFGDDRVGMVDEPTMGGEDFAFYGKYVPACFYLLGVRPADMEVYPSLHQPDYDFNDDALATGVEMMCRLALA